MDKDGKHTDPLPPADRIRSIVLQPPARLMLGKTGDDGDFKRSEHVSSRTARGENQADLWLSWGLSSGDTVTRGYSAAR